MACGDASTAPGAEDDLELSVTSAVLEPGESLQLRVVDAAAKTVRWSSSNPAVATVTTSGVVTAIDSGSALISATAGRADGTARVTVEEEDAPAPPQVAGGTLISGHDFNDGTWGPFPRPRRGNPADYSIVNDPTGSGRGKVARLHYHRDAASDPELDKNRAFKPSDHTRGLTGPDGQSFGDTGYFKGDVYIEKGSMSGYLPQYDQRKLFYPKFGDWTNGGLRHDWSLILWGRKDGSGMDLLVVSGTRGSAGYPEYRKFDYGVAPVRWNTWHTVESEWRLNDVGQANARLRVWLDGRLVYERTNFMMVAPHPTNPRAYYYLYEVEVGDQQQGNTSSSQSLFNSYRFWDNIQFRTARP
ncbi:MAG TPA: Ig-like domain-containing protein [Longimicrobiaceae bacterium]|nr:Ig-like domain-containing protein [Longimicrobiaceae bacterium]